MREMSGNSGIKKMQGVSGCPTCTGILQQKGHLPDMLR